MTIPPVIFQDKGWGAALQEGLAPLLTILAKRREWQARQQELQIEERRVADMEKRTQQSGEMDQVRKQQLKADIDARTTELEQRKLVQRGTALSAGIYGSLVARGLQPGSPEWNAEALKAMAPYAKDEALPVIQQDFEERIALHTKTQADVDRQAKQHQVQEIIKSYGGKTDMASRRAMLTQVAQVDPTASVQLAQSLESTDARYAPVQTADAAGKPTVGAFNQRSGTVTDTGAAGRQTGGASNASVIQRIAPRLRPLDSAFTGMEEIERTDPKAVDQVAAAYASGRLKYIGAGMEWIKGLGFTGNAKKYSMLFAAAADNLIGMQYNVRSNMQVELWKQALIPMYGEATKNKQALLARQRMRREMEQGYRDVIRGRADPASMDDPTPWLNKIGVKAPAGGVPNYEGYAPPETPEAP